MSWGNLLRIRGQVSSGDLGKSNDCHWRGCERRAKADAHVRPVHNVRRTGKVEVSLRSAKRTARTAPSARSRGSPCSRSRKQRSSPPSVLGSVCRSVVVRLMDGSRHLGALVKRPVASNPSELWYRFIAQSRTTGGPTSVPARISPRDSSAALWQPARQRASRSARHGPRIVGTERRHCQDGSAFRRSQIYTVLRVPPLRAGRGRVSVTLRPTP